MDETRNSKEATNHRNYSRRAWFAVAAALLVLTGCQFVACRAQHETQLNSNVQSSSSHLTEVNQMSTGDTRFATFGGGCFWCTEAVFLELEGVQRVVSGYSGGHVKNPTYQQVCSGRTGHAEVIQIEYDPARVSFEQLLEVHFKTHDPTTLNRQGHDTGTQYRSVIFYHDDEQKRIAEEIIKALDEAGAYPSPIVTEVAASEHFYPAENYHQNYYAENAGQPYCQAVVRPKVEKFRKAFADRLKK